VNDLDSDGYALADLVLAAHQCEHIASSLPALTAAGRAGVRDLISHSTIAQLLRHERLGACLWSAIGRDLVAVKVTLLDKTPAANWRVQWHQDRVITVKERLAVHGYGPWRTRSGTDYVEPPEEVLAQMVALRIHLDDCGSENGPLRVIPGSHLHGKLDAAAIAEMVASRPVVELSAPQGAMVLMRPLLLHASSPSVLPGHRRVLHIEFAPREAISPLQWHTAVALRRVA
jgi:ectoine hydroxylase-related dioxygenase (phytanoyl-CoA dioxygenase family)